MTKVLIVEDDDINMILIFEILNAYGIMVDGAENGKEAIKKIENEIYDLILMDIELPGMDGIETTRIIKTRPEYKDVPVIALTAYAMKGDRERFLKAGLDDYIPKPIHVDDFMERMKKYIKFVGLRS
ncbi:MAG: response regulator [Euryarchaeota archaeon]|nr:response regulator [Euryarchaeota archaeon]MBU4221119.1 response regulator [Euryarchaeota archaeon]